MAHQIGRKEIDIKIIPSQTNESYYCRVYKQKEIKDGNERKDVEPAIEWKYPLMTLEQSQHSGTCPQFDWQHQTGFQFFKR